MYEVIFFRLLDSLLLDDEDLFEQVTESSGTCCQHEVEPLSTFGGTAQNLILAPPSLGCPVLGRSYHSYISLLVVQNVLSIRRKIMRSRN